MMNNAEGITSHYLQASMEKTEDWYLLENQDIMYINDNR